MSIALSAVPLDLDRWERCARAVKAGQLAAEPLRLAATAPASWDAVLDASHSGSLRANALTLAAYLADLGIAGTLRSTAGEVVRQLFHHGDVVVDGDLVFLRCNGEPIANVITGNLRVTGELTGSAFDSELMVAGTIDCGALITDAEIGCGGLVRCRYARLGWYDCTSAFEALEAELVIDHGQIVEGGLKASVVITCDDHNTSIPDSEMASIDRLADELRAAVRAAGDDGSAVYKAVDAAARAAVAAGRPLLRA